MFIIVHINKFVDDVAINIWVKLSFECKCNVNS
jgi:hypothetical protein